MAVIPFFKTVLHNFLIVVKLFKSLKLMQFVKGFMIQSKTVYSIEILPLLKGLRNFQNRNRC